MRSGLWSILGALMVLAGCASDVGDVNRVQPNAVDKRIFQPEQLQDGTTKEKVWFFRPTVTDVPLSSGFTFIGNQGDTEKVVWDIQEDMLVAYRAYEFTKGSEAYAARPGNRYRGAPVAAFPILSHFDIQRDYNPATGEQTNVIVENSSDRPWYERQYMRIDWGGNKIADFRFSTAEVKQQAQYFVQPTDPDSKDRPVIGDDYIDISTKIFAEPETITFEGYGTFPRCYLWSDVTHDCVGQAIKVRYSFMRDTMDEEAYEPQPYDDKMMFKFGFFKTNRYTYDRERDLLEARTEQYAERFNLWLKSRHKNPDGTFTTIPFKDRTLRPVVFYVNDQFPKEDNGDALNLIEDAQDTADEWNNVFVETVEKATGKKPGRMVYLCRNNPVTADDTNLKDFNEADLAQFTDSQGNTSVPFPNEEKAQNKICGPGPKFENFKVTPGLNPQIGDLRFSFQYWVPNPQSASPLGYGPHAADPETGRVVSANAFIYGAPLETYASYVADTVALMNDDLTEKDLYEGTYLRQSLKERLGKVPDVFKSADALRDYVNNRRIDLRAKQVRDLVKKGELKQDFVRANLEALRGGYANNFMMTEEVVKGLGFGVEYGAQYDEQTRRALDPSTWGHPAFLSWEKERINRLSANDITTLDFYDDSVLSRALRMASKYDYRDMKLADGTACSAGNANKTTLEECRRLRWVSIRKDLMHELYTAVELHEVGHTFGLRHNFAASTDALNYQTDSMPHLSYFKDAINTQIAGGKKANNYWWVREQIQKPAQGTNPLVPAYLKPFDPDMVAAYPIHELEYSSIMDYGEKPNGDFYGLGKYDKAAIRFGYANLVDVFDPAAAGMPNQKLRPDLGDLLKAGERHYTNLPLIFADSTNVKDIDKGIKLMIEGRKTIPYSELLDARAKAKASGAGDVPTEVPYRFCSDEYVGGSAVCYRFDAGPDMYEMTKSIRELYENLYWFNNFKRGRVNFALGGSVGGYLNRIYARYFDVLDNQYKHFINDEFIQRGARNDGKGVECPADLGSTEMVDHYVSTVCGLDMFASQIESLNFFAKVLQTPDATPNLASVSDGAVYGFNAEKGIYQKGYDSTMGPNPANPSEIITGQRPVDEIKIDLTSGKFANTKYDREKYGYTFFYKPVIVGSWWDKYMAIMALGNPYTDFIGVDAGSDVNSYLFNFNLLFASDVNNMVGGLAIESFKDYAPVMDKTTGKFAYRKVSGLYSSDVPNYNDASRFKVIDPDEQYTARLIAAYLGIAYFSQDTNDAAFINSIKINVAGMGESPTVPASVDKNDPNQYVEITDPNTHRIYWATRWDYVGYDGKIDQSVLPVGFSLLKNIKERAKTGSDIRSELHFVDILRGMLHQYEYVRGL